MSRPAKVNRAPVPVMSTLAGLGGSNVVPDVEDLGDVDVTGILDGQVLVWDSGTSTWIPGDAGGSPADDNYVWMPLTTVVAGDPVLVWDGDDGLIPTLVPV